MKKIYIGLIIGLVLVGAVIGFSGKGGFQRFTGHFVKDFDKGSWEGHGCSKEGFEGKHFEKSCGADCPLKEEGSCPFAGKKEWAEKHGWTEEEIMAKKKAWTDKYSEEDREKKEAWMIDHYDTDGDGTLSSEELPHKGCGGHYN